MSCEWRKPSEIRFTHDSIQPHFQDLRYPHLNQTINDIVSGKMSWEDLPTIEVAEFQNQLYSINNRRLYVFRVLQHERVLTKIPVKKVSVNKLRPGKCTTNNYGVSIRLRRDTTKKHALAPQLLRDSTLQRDIENYFNNQRTESQSVSQSKAYYTTPPEEITELTNYNSTSNKSREKDDYKVALIGNKNRRQVNIVLPSYRNGNEDISERSCCSCIIM